LLGCAYTHHTQLCNKGNAVGAEKKYAPFLLKDYGALTLQFSWVNQRISRGFVGERLQFTPLITQINKRALEFEKNV